MTASKPKRKVTPVTRWQSFGRSLLPGRKDAKGNSLFGKQVEFRIVSIAFEQTDIEEKEFRAAKPNASAPR